MGAGTTILVPRAGEAAPMWARAGGARAANGLSAAAPPARPLAGGGGSGRHPSRRGGRLLGAAAALAGIEARLWFPGCQGLQPALASPPNPARGTPRRRAGCAPALGKPPAAGEGREPGRAAAAGGRRCASGGGGWCWWSDAPALGHHHHHRLRLRMPTLLNKIGPGCLQVQGLQRSAPGRHQRAWTFVCRVHRCPECDSQRTALHPQAVTAERLCCEEACGCCGCSPILW